MTTDLSNLNEQQKQAVLQSIDHNVVLMAGAGSGKTSTLVKRTQYLINDIGVNPSNIMLVTFTNKAAGEIRDRIAAVSPDAYKMWIGTFHRICVRLIRMFGDHLNIGNFTIMDSRDSKNLIRGILESKGIQTTPFMINAVQSKISEYKNNIIRPAQALASGDNRMYADAYQEYQNISWQRKTFDFDDLIIYTILLLSSYPDVADWCHDTFKYIMVDETQDTNSAQFQLIKLLVGDNNTMLVGDSNQSIYAFRNAKPQYLENFANTHPNTIKLKLEQNYRSTKNIINAANEVVMHNKFGTKIHMFCDNEKGERIKLYKADEAFAEARWLTSEILAHVQTGNKKLSDFAIIYRANKDSRIIEEELMSSGVAYTIFGSQSFYSRKEVKDLLAYCKVVLNDKDIDSFSRILGTGKGIGKTTINKITEYAISNNIGTHDVIKAFDATNPSGIKAGAWISLNTINDVLNKKYTKCSEIIETVFVLTDYKKELEAIGSEEAQERLEIMQEFYDSIRNSEERDPNASMAEIVDQIELLAETKGADKDQLDAVKLMTAHASKGLEFDTVFIIGAEEGSFPHANALDSKEEVEEERRLFYVAMTRAKKQLYITRRNTRRSKQGDTYKAKPSRFLKEIPVELTEYVF